MLAVILMSFPRLDFETFVIHPIGPRETFDRLRSVQVTGDFYQFPCHWIGVDFIDMQVRNQVQVLGVPDQFREFGYLHSGLLFA